jgi:hypothetical protein
VLAGAAIAAYLPWTAWQHANGTSASGDFDLGRLLHPGYLADEASRLAIGLEGLAHFLFSPDEWLVTIPVALALAAAAALRRPALALYAFLTTALTVLGFGAIYWVGSIEIHEYVDTSARRLVSSTGLFCAAVAPLLLAEARVDSPAWLWRGSGSSSPAAQASSAPRSPGG